MLFKLLYLGSGSPRLHKIFAFDSKLEVYGWLLQLCQKLGWLPLAVFTIRKTKTHLYRQSFQATLIGSSTRLKLAIVFHGWLLATLPKTWLAPSGCLYYTQNKIEPHKIYPAEGVYITHTRVGDKGYYGLTNVGFAPTVRDDERTKTIENYLYKFNEKIYGQEVKVEFLQFLRAEKKFASHKELVAQLKSDLRSLKQFIRVH